jgi:hypothetical protein
MSENQFKYGTSMTSVRVHQRPGGNSTFSLGWGEEEKKSVPEPAKVVPPAEEEKKEEEIRREEEIKREEELRKKEEEEKKKKEEEAKAATKSRVPPGGKTSFSFY